HLQSPTKADVLSKIQNCQIVHFTCHGETNPLDPSQSRLMLQDWQTDPLTVGDIVREKLKTSQLAYLAACYTARNPVEDTLDEGLHLAGACQLAGFSHVVGSLWSIRDDVAVKVAASFYTSLTDGSNYIDISRGAWGLHCAVRGLRDGPRMRDKPILWAS